MSNDRMERTDTLVGLEPSREKQITELRRDWVTAMLREMGIASRVLEYEGLRRTLITNLVPNFPLPDNWGLAKVFLISEVQSAGFSANKFKAVLQKGQQIWEEEAKTSDQKTAQRAKNHARVYGEAVSYLSTREEKYRDSYERVVKEQEQIALQVVDIDRASYQSYSQFTQRDRAWSQIKAYSAAAMQFGLASGQ